MGRRAVTHDYSRPGIYHITIRVADGLGQPLGTVVGTDADSASVALTPVGEAIQHELLTAITTHYGMIAVDTYVVMPEHLHFILTVHAPIVSKSGRPAHLGQVIAGFKKGCNRAYWAATGQTPPATPAGKPQGAVSGATPGAEKTAEKGAAGPEKGAEKTAEKGAAGPEKGAADAEKGAATAPGGLPAGSRPPSNGTSGRPPLFAPHYCDVMPIEPRQLETQRAYIRNNPRSRWLRSHDRARLQPQRGGIDTAVTPTALRRYLQQVCASWQASDEALAAIEHRLLLADGHITCDSYGDRGLLQRPLLPVVCHRDDEARRAEQQTRCLEAAARGAVLVSPRIAPGEQAIIDAAANHGFPVILIADNGFPTIYHPSTERIDHCADGRLLLVSPWQYEYRGKDEQITVPFCKTMNCVAQALCKKKDDWWKTAATTVSGDPAATASSGFPAIASGSPAATASGGFPARTTPEQNESHE